MAFSVSFVFKATDKYSAVLNKIASATKHLTSEMNKLDSASGKFKTCLAGISTESNQLIGRMRGNAKATGTYTASMKQATAATKAQAAAMKSLKVINGGRATGGGGGTRSPVGRSIRKGKSVGKAMESAVMPFAGLGAVAVAPAAIAINEARKFQSSFSELRKVFNGTNAELATTRNNILDLANKYPMASAGIIRIAADASEAGIQFKELSRFTEIAIQAGVAFDMSSEDVGEALAKTKNAFKMTVEEMNNYGNQVNFLSNNQASKAKEIINKVKELSGISSTLKLSAGNTAAFASTMLHVAQPVERVDGAIKDLMGTIAAPSVMPKKSKAMFQQVMGMPIQAVSKSAQTDQLGSMMFVLKKIKETGGNTVDVISSIFGKQYSSELAALVGSYDLLSKSLKDVNNEEKTRDSMLKEYIIRSQTLDNQLLKTKNILLNIAEEAGRSLLPVINNILMAAQPVLLLVFDWVRQNSKLAAGILLVSSAIGGMLLALAGIGLVIGGLSTFGTLLLSITGQATLASAASAALSGVFTSLGGAVGFLTGPWGRLIILVGTLYAKWMPFRELINSLINLFLAFATKAIAESSHAIRTLCSLLNGLWTIMLKIGGWLANSPMGKAVGGMMSGMAGGINAFASSMNKDTKSTYGLSAPTMPKYNAEVTIHHQMPQGMPAPVTKIKSSKGLSVRTGSNMH